MAALFNSEALRHHYALPKDVVLLNGHVYQIPPNEAVASILAAHYDAGQHPDDRWMLTCAAAQAVRLAVTKRLEGANPDHIALGQTTDELLALCLQRLPPAKRSVLTVDDGLNRVIQLISRQPDLKGIGTTTLNEGPVKTIAERLLRNLTPGTGAILVSQVLDKTGEIVPYLEGLAEEASKRDVEVLIRLNDFGVVPFYAKRHPSATLLGSGESHAQWGEGVAWLRLPEHASEFRYQFECALRRTDPFSYDPTSHYRARAVDELFAELELTVPALRSNSLRQTDLLLAGLDGYKVVTPRDPKDRGSFVAIQMYNADWISPKLKAHGLWVDDRRGHLRFGPAPYTTDEQIAHALVLLRKLAPPT